MKIAILGYSGSGKSTLARALGKRYGLPVLHFDAIQFLPGWEIRALSEKQKMTEEFMNSHADWVIDGNYSRLLQERRLEEADGIVLLLLNRFSCLFRVLRRFFRYRNASRPDMGEGCNEKIDREFVYWVLFEGRTKERKAHYREIAARYGEKTTVIKSQRQLTAYYRAHSL